ncbi:MAG: hypothetical protein ACI8Y7_000244 [Candidatus Woesearchaeota archaeon]|jgi:hypothetical protein
MSLCEKCSKITGGLFLLAGIFSLLADLAIWDVWGLSASTLFFVIVGVVLVASSSCKDCCKA